ncbi:MAG: NAD(P)-dependent oxidoreductase [Cyanobacteria bacterium P01_H01_bin.74]
MDFEARTSPITQQKIAVVGLGRMGGNIARRLVACGLYLVRLYDNKTPVAQSLSQELNVPVAQSLAEVTAQAAVVITVVTDDAAMADIYTHPADNLLKNTDNALGTVFINCATVSPDSHQQINALTRHCGAAALELPMASSIPQAVSGTLFLMAAGKKVVFDYAAPLLDLLGETVIYTGETGTASTLKALLNMVMIINTAALAEGLGLADALGLDLKMVCDVFSKTGAHSRVLETDSQDMINQDYETFFSAAHAAKDTNIALKLGESTKLPLPLARVTAELYQAMVDRGLGELDKSGIAELQFKTRPNKNSL